MTLAKELTDESGSLPLVAEPGETLTYTVTLTNDGPGATFDLADELDENTEYVVGSTSGTAGVGEPTGTGPLVWEDIVVPSEDEVTVVYQVKVADPIPAGISTVGNVVYAAGAAPECASNPATCVEIPVPGDVSLEKTLSDEDGVIDGIAEPGETPSFTVTLTNQGAGAALYDLADDLDEDMSYIKGSTSGTAGTGEPIGADPVTWRGITVPAGDSVTVTYQVKVADQFSVNGRILRNIAYKEAAGPNCATNPASCVDIPPPGRVKLEKSLTGEGGMLDGVAEPGETLSYTVTLTNDEDVESLIDLADKIDAHTTYVKDSTTGTAGADEPVGSDPLVWKSLVIPAKTAVTVEYQVKVAEEIPEDVENVLNLVYRHGDPEPDCAAEPDHCVTVPVPGPVRLEKALTGESGLLDDLAEPGEILTYRVTLTNEGGGAALYDLSDKIDSHSSYIPGSTSGTADVDEPEGTNPLSWRGIVVPAGQDVTVEYDVRVADTIPSGTQNIGNIAYREGTEPDCAANLASCITIPVVSVTKMADRQQIRRGEQVPFTLRVLGGTGTLTVTDRLPSGFRFVEGSATVNGTPAAPIVEGQRVIFENLTFGDEPELVIRLLMAALPSVTPGKYVNRVGVDGPNGQRMAEASAEVEIIVEPVFDCGEIIGKVFDDLDRNGYQDAGEPGLAGVRISTVSGLVVTTGPHGRFHVACADLPERIGTNFIMKVDPRSLPTGYRLISENPRVVRLTAGKASRINFAATVGRVVRLDVNDAAFEPGTVLLKSLWQAELQRVIELLENEVSVLRLAYVDAGADHRLANRRISEIRRAISELWKAKPGRYRLEIETRVETRK